MAIHYFRIASMTKIDCVDHGVALNDVMTDMQKASVSMQMGIQVRNKLVAAYQEVMSMQV